MATLFFVVYGTAFGQPDPVGVPVLVIDDQAVAERLDASPNLAALDVATLDEARERLAAGDAYGAIAVQSDGSMDLLLASGKGRSGASVVSGAATSMAAATGSIVRTEEVVPLAAGNPTGTFEFYVVVFLGLVGGLGATVLSRLLTSERRGRRPFLARVGTFAVYTAAAALLFALLAGPVLDAFPGSFGGLFVTFWGYALATALAVGGIYTVLGPIAAGAASLVLTVFGNASAAGPVVREAMPALYRSANPFLPHGAAIDLIRGVQYFDGAGIGGAVITLAMWATLGLVGLYATLRFPRTLTRVENQISETSPFTVEATR
ncbi:MAG: hypothetical protein R2743_19640 [Ilumatobacteraceae bacterium]